MYCSYVIIPFHSLKWTHSKWFPHKNISKTSFPHTGYTCRSVVTSFITAWAIDQFTLAVRLWTGILEVSGTNLGQVTRYSEWYVRDFANSFQENARTVLRLGHDPSRSSPFQFHTHWSPYCATLFRYWQPG